MRLRVYAPELPDSAYRSERRAHPMQVEEKHLRWRVEDVSKLHPDKECSQTELLGALCPD